jgi:hypothetical protein
LEEDVVTVVGGDEAADGESHARAEVWPAFLYCA